MRSASGAGEDLPAAGVLLHGRFEVDAGDVEREGGHPDGMWGRCPGFPRGAGQAPGSIRVYSSAQSDRRIAVGNWPRAVRPLSGATEGKPDPL
jgi:hypothetical protein